MMNARPLALLAVLVSTACGGFDSAIPLLGPPGDRTALEGHWEGEFESTAAHRGGVIDVDIPAPADTAFGVVVLVPRYGPNPDAADPRRPRPEPVVLEVEFLEVRGAELSGRLMVYPDPVTGEETRTDFTGRLEGGRIAGTYVARSLSSGDAVTGHWEMRRKR